MTGEHMKVDLEKLLAFAKEMGFELQPWQVEVARRLFDDPVQDPPV
jgi:hypothetical protein